MKLKISLPAILFFTTWVVVMIFGFWFATSTDPLVDFIRKVALLAIIIGAGIKVALYLAEKYDGQSVVINVESLGLPGRPFSW